MRDLLLLFNQVQTLWNRRVVLVLVLPDLEQNLDHVLTPLADRSLVKNGSESLENRVVRFGTVLREEQADFSHETNGDFD